MLLSRLAAHGAPVLNMPALPIGPTGATARLEQAPALARRRPEQAIEGVRILQDPRLSWWPSFLAGKHWQDKDLPLEGAPRVGLPDKQVWVPHVRQGALGDCWLMGTLAAMALAGDAQYHPGIRRLDEGHVALRMGAKEVGVRDTLPFKRDGKLAYARQNAPHFSATWPIYYEKAAAAMVGSYQQLNGGWPREAFALLLGAEPTRVQAAGDMFKYMRTARESGLPVAVSTRSSQTRLMDEVGIHSNHTYALREVITKPSDGRTPAEVGVRLWNPWGHEHPRTLTYEQFQTICDSITTPKEYFTWGGVHAQTPH